MNLAFGCLNTASAVDNRNVFSLYNCMLDISLNTASAVDNRNKKNKNMNIFSLSQYRLSGRQ